MTAREFQIAKKILDRLHALDGGQEHHLAVHAAIGGLNFCSGQDFDEVLTELDRRRWIVGVKSESKGLLISISDLGESARRKL
ncbi:MAG TPA: hypothetical protein VK742_20390 [Candidatus Sulfotelmatobacter sp.]|jgi:hypothetical protein|nr:hypothetical protein [Candidatus Sulfotelmatobacter sp.]